MDQVRTYLELLMKTEDKPTPVEAGKMIFEQGQPGKQMYLVQSGSVELRVEGRVLETVGEGGVLGEMALVDREPRSATAVATADSLLVEIDEERFRLLVQRVPGFALEVMRVMAQRIRRANPKPSAPDQD
jgi:CRP-like cAMP-binding protein